MSEYLSWNVLVSRAWLTAEDDIEYSKIGCSNTSFKKCCLECFPFDPQLSLHSQPYSKFLYSSPRCCRTLNQIGNCFPGFGQVGAGRLCIISMIIPKIMPSMVEPNKNMQVPCMGLRISVQWSFIYSIFNLASESILALLKISCLADNYYVQALCWSLWRKLKTQFLLPESLLSNCVDRQAYTRQDRMLVVLYIVEMLRWEKFILMRGLEKVDGRCDIRAGLWKFKLLEMW